jgi:GntR family transcriptional regulator
MISLSRSKSKKKAIVPSRARPKLDGAPRYRSVENDLIEAIASGRYPVGSTLPNEHDLCIMFGVSRFTIREAMRRLSEAGLVSRKQRAGTVVIAANGIRPYLQTLETLEDIQQYAKDTHIRIVYLGKIKVTKALARDIPMGVGEKWHAGLAIRFQAGLDVPICVTRIYVNPAFKDIPKWIRNGTDAIYKNIERRYGTVVTRVEQKIHAIALMADDALHLKTKPNSPALRNVRLYYDETNRLLEATDNIHPGDRFSYAMLLRKSQ